MADHQYVHPDRRGSFPNRVSERERRPPPQPTRSSSSYSNNMDPRLSNYNRDPRKRNASQSPNGGQARKQSKADTPLENENTGSTNSGSRRSSISNGTPRLNNASAPHDPRRSSIQPGGVVVKPTDNMSNPSDALANGESNTLTKLLTDFGNQLAEQAQLQISRDQAQARSKRHQLEYNTTSNKFAAFPAVKERRAGDRDAYQKETSAREQKVTMHVQSQQQLIQSLSSLIAAAKQQDESSVVSRADHDKVKADLTAANSMIEKLKKEMQAKFETLNQTVASIQTKHNDFSKDIGMLKAKGTAASINQQPASKADAVDPEFKQKVDKMLEEDGKYKSDVDSLLAKGTDLYSRVEALERQMPQARGDTDAQKQLQSELGKVAHELSEFKIEQTEKDTMVSDAIDDLQGRFDELKGSIGEEMQALNTGRDEDKKVIRADLEKVDHEFQKVREEVGTKASADSVDVIKGDVSTLSGELKKLQVAQQSTRSASQTPVVPTQPQRLSNGSPHLPNGVGSSPQVNGVQHPQVNGVIPPAPNHTQEIAGLHAQVSALINVTQHLKQRMDNMQTDEMVKMMVNQFSATFPDARNFNVALDSLTKTCHQLFNRLGKVEQEFAPIKRLDVETKIKTLGKELNDVVKAAENAEKLSGELKASLDNFNANELRIQVNGHENKIVKGKSVIDGLNKTVNELKVVVDVLKKAISETRGEVGAIWKIMEE